MQPTNIIDDLNLLEAGMLGTCPTSAQEAPTLAPGTPAWQQVVVHWNKTSVDFPEAGACVHQLFEAQAQRTPGSIAVVCGSAQLTYQNLNTQANRLAHYLRSLGVRPEMPVGICVEHSLEMLVGVIGILKAGGAYVPLDPSYPEERLAFMLSDAGISIVLSQFSLYKKSNFSSRAQALYLEHIGELTAGLSHDNLPETVSPGNLAYVLYTSGSTGRPKGVQVTHAALTNLLLAMRQLLQVTEREVVLALTTLAFDIAAVELFLPLLVGARTVIAPRETALSGNMLAATLQQQGITLMQATPTTWRMLLDTGWPGIPYLKMLSGGEALPPSLADRLLEKGAGLWNGYGPTEATIYATVAAVERGEKPVSIGRPIANTQAYLLDQRLQPVPVGMAGELYLGGAGVARGYLNRPELTAECFIPDPFHESPGARLYRTGDLSCHQEDGTIVYLGRSDHQIKLRGVRIELGEIEEVLRGHPAVVDVRVLPHDFGPADRRLVAYVVCGPQETRTLELYDWASRRLPDVMVPPHFVFLPALPLLPNGKLDMHALSDPARVSCEVGAGDSPRSSTEHTLADIWSEVLAVAPVGINESFFTLGGNSLHAAQVMDRVRRTWGAELPVSTLFEAPTIALLARLIDQALANGRGQRAEEDLIVPVERAPQPPGTFPLSTNPGQPVSYEPG